MKRISMLCLGVFLVGLLLVGSVPAWGQATTQLKGVVTDPSGAAVPKAQVTLINTGTNLQRQVTTGNDGSYQFREIQPGTYRLIVEVQDFKKYIHENVTVFVHLPATLDVQLQLGARTEVVEVTEQTPLLNTTDASVGQTMGSSQIQQLPLEAGNVVQLLSLQPGVVYTTNRTDIDPNIDTRSGAVNGERSDQSNVTLDGVDVNDQSNGYAFTSVLPVTVASVQEFRVTTSNYNADEGRSAGAEVALVTRGGTNEVHGSLYGSNRNTATVANDFFIKTAELASGQPNRPPKLIRNVFGGWIGGPFMKDRFFFFLNYEGHRQAEQQSVVRVIPSLTLRDGIIMYPCADRSKCPGGSVTGASGASYPVPAGDFGLGPTQLNAMDPLGIGPNSAALSLFQSYPKQPNDTTVGDTLNYTGFRFPGPVRARNDWLIGRLDYKITANGNHTLFWRGSGRDDVLNDVPYLPGQASLATTVDLSKGFVLGYTGIFRPNLVNNFRYGLTRQSLGVSGNSSQPWIFMRNFRDNIDPSTTFFRRSRDFTLPVHNIVDDVSWIKGNHSLVFGANLRLVYSARISQLNSFSGGSTNASWLDTAAIANTTSPLDPANKGFPAVDPGFGNSYDFPLMAMMGIVSEVDATYNFDVHKNGTGIPLAQGAPVSRHYAIYEDGFYAQDSWKMRHNFTLNYGLRYEFITAPWETRGQEVAPTMNLGAWFTQRGINMGKGIPSSQDPPVVFDLAGRSNGRADLWPSAKKNFAPRVSFAWSPEPNWGWLKHLLGSGGRTVVRAGFGMYYDHFGQGMLNTFDRNGSFGLSSTLSNPAAIQTVSSSPRIANMNVIPTTDKNGNAIFTPSPPAKFPQAFPNTLAGGGFCICWGLDSSIRSPYSYALDFSVSRQLPGNMSLEVGYIGHLARRLLIQDDLAMPLDLVDTKTGIDYFSAATRFSQLARAKTPTSTVNATLVGPTAAYWQNLIAPLTQPGAAYSLACSGGSTTDPVQAAYDLFSCGVRNETTPLSTLDLFGIPDANLSNVSYFTIFGPNAFFNAQYSSLYAWRSISNSSYHALQATLRKRMSHGLQFDFNYTFSKSIDLTSDAERIDAWGGLGGQIINAWSPKQLKGVSDFDLIYQINANWIWQLPFGQGRWIGGHVGKGLDGFIGGWQLSGLSRWTSGFPANVAHGFEWPTDWQLSGQATLTGVRPPAQKTVLDGKWNLFSSRQTALSAFDHPFPGQSGARNTIRGDGYFGLDMGLAKNWKMPYSERHTLQFRWDVFNVLNTKRFDVQTAKLELDQSTSFGNYTHLLTNPRVMQFGLRYQF